MAWVWFSTSELVAMDAERFGSVMQGWIPRSWVVVEKTEDGLGWVVWVVCSLVERGERWGKRADIQVV